MTLFKKAKTHKGKRALEHKAAKMIENPKTAIFMKGTKCSNIITNFMRDLYKLRGTEELSKLFLRKGHDYHPLDNVGPLEQFSKN